MAIKQWVKLGAVAAALLLIPRRSSQKSASPPVSRPASLSNAVTTKKAADTDQDSQLQSPQ